MKIWQRIFLASVLVTISFMNLIGIVLIRSQYQQNLEYIQQETETKLVTLAEKLQSEIKSNIAKAQQIEIVTILYENEAFVADDFSILNAIQTITEQEDETGVCIFMDGRAYTNARYENLKTETDQPRFATRKDGSVLFCTVASGQYYGRKLEIVVQTDATVAKENYWNQMNQLLFYGCLFSVFGAAILMSLVSSWRGDRLPVCYKAHP